MTAAQSRIAALVIVIVAVAASAFAFMTWRQSQVDAFSASAKAALANVDLVLDRALLTVRAVQGLYADNPALTEEELARFVEGIGPVAGLRAIVYQPRVLSSERAEFERELIRSGKSPNGIWTIQDGKPVRAAEADAYFPVAATYFFAEAGSTYGFDIRSNPTRRFPLDMAIETRLGTSTDVVTFVSSGEDPVRGVIFYKPVVVDGEVVGIVSGSVELKLLISLARAAAPEIQDLSIDIGPLDIAGGAPVDFPNVNDDSQPFLVVSEQNHSGRLWRFRMSGKPDVSDYARGYGLMTLVLLAGLGAAAAVVGYSTAARRGRDLKSAETRLRRTLDGLVPLVFMTDPNGLLITANRAALDASSNSVEDLVGKPLEDLPLWDDDPGNKDALHLAILRASAGEERRLDVLSTETELGQTVYDVAVRPIAGERGDITHLVVSALDVSERVEAAETERLLMRELDHRMKNTLQVVQGVVRRTARSHNSVGSFESALLGRITTMARAHDLLARERWLGADLRTVILQEIQPFEEGRSVTVSGPPIRVNPKGALALALAIHELGTNAIKYGALSVPEGRLDIEWSLEGDDRDRMLVFNWWESEGPKVSIPDHRGFGSLLLERSITYDLDGRTHLDFAPDGVSCRIEIPWERVRPMTASIHFRERLAEGVSA
ncbi:HWE histidine kinase domain-containing protein [Microbaculum marinum]|uniref:Blue-light-activated histidine kinase n=1 Tax=Microbaculum marinum TaxID=1764581 RepID=A0AAW9RIE5_9HYPH